MKKIIFYSLVVLLYLAVPILVLGIINTMVSLKYETGGGLNDCISGITGEDLCVAIKTMKYLAASALIGATVLLVFRKKVLS